MFSFLFKRSAKPAPSAADKQKNQDKDDASALAAEKTTAIAMAQQLAADETAAAEFILQCRFADARLEAAKHVQSKQLLERLAQAMRDTDRRVARLVQQRLDAIRQGEATEREAVACVERMQALAKEAVILPNQVADIERSWSALHAVPQNRVEEFERSRAALQQRLHDQTALQRRLIEVRNAAQGLTGELETLPPGEPTEALRARLDMLAEQHAAALTSTETPSLPRTLLSDIEAKLAHARRLVEELTSRQAAIFAHEQACSAWEADPESLPDLNALRRAQRTLPALDARDAHLFEARLALLQARFEKPSRAPKVEAEVKKPDMEKYQHALEALERALEEGALQAAAEHEKELRADDHLALVWNPDEAARLARARAELNRLKGWARWGGKISREELVKAAEELPRKETNLVELAKKVGSLRSQWKSMDAASGVADREAWQRFDAACTAAYAPVAAHFNAMAAERKANLEKAQAIFSQIREFAEREAGEAHAPDWENTLAFRSHIQQAWREIGPVDRREKKVLDRQFSDALDALFRPFAAAQQEEIKRREELIEQVQKIDPSGRNAMTALQQVQQQWQQQAKSLPLERKDEQALWMRFRAACDELVTHRKAALQQTDAQHAENYRLKSALCNRLESEANGAPENFERLLNEVEQQWKTIGPVTRAGEQALQERRQSIVSGMHARRAEEKQAAQREQFERLFRKFALCSAAEQMLRSEEQQGQAADVAVLENEWKTSDALQDDFEQALHTRFLAALSAVRSGDTHYAALLKQNRAALERDMLRMEIKLEIESPPELASERLKLQVEALQASLKSGGQSFERNNFLLRLCQLPAFHDQESLARVESMIHRLGEDRR